MAKRQTYQLDTVRDNGHEHARRYHNLARARAAFDAATRTPTVVNVMLWDVTGGGQEGVDGWWRN